MLETVAPQRVFHYFEDLCAIPHGSGNTAAISDYCARFAASHGLDCVQDSLHNIIIRKPASKGYETHPAVILQGHLDMVCEKVADSDFDFTKDGLRLSVDGDLLSADGTTLGADDGIAVAMILAVLEDDTLAHPPIEALFTVDEETGMDGAEGVDVTGLAGSTLINLDSGEEGVLTVGCAGGAKVDIRMPVQFTENTLPCQKIVLSGLCGGHSGIDINKGRLNACKLLGKFLSELPAAYRLVSIFGGFKDNVIPNACECVIACNEDVSAFAAHFAEENRLPTDSGLTVTVSEAALSPCCLTETSGMHVVQFLMKTVFGVVAMSKEMEGLVESSQNLGIVRLEDSQFHAVLSVRSSVAAEKQKMLDQLQALAETFDAQFSTHGHYPAWEYRPVSRLRDTMIAVYTELYRKPPVIETVHAGLECGLFSEKIANFDAVSMGPDMWDIHTVNERLSISSTARTYSYLCQVLKEL